MKTDRELLKEANELIRSFNSIIERKGSQTNWDGIDKQVKRVLREHHELKLFAIPDVVVSEAEVCEHNFELISTRFALCKCTICNKETASVCEKCLATHY